MGWARIVFLSLAFVALSGCGTTLPVMRIQHPSDEDFRKFVFAIAAHVKCELANAVAIEYSPHNPLRKDLFDWAAKIALTVRALDRGNFNPGASVNDSLGRFTLAVGGDVSTSGTREMTMTYFLLFKELLDGKKIPWAQREPKDCALQATESKIYDPIAGDLGIHQTFKAAFETWDARRTLSERIQGGPFDTISHHVTFEVIAGGGITPTWKLANVTANATSPLLGASRTTTDELLITIGPNTLAGRKELESAFQVERLRSVINRR